MSDSDLVIFWHRRDLRLRDHVGLAAAQERTSKIVGVFCFDLAILQRDDIAPARVSYMLGCLAELEKSYVKIGGELVFLQGDPLKVIPQLAEDLEAKAVYWSLDVEPYAQKRDENIKQALHQKGIASVTSWDQLLHAPNEVLSLSDTPYTVYTPFWKNWSKKTKALPLATISNLERLTVEERNKIQSIALPTLNDLGYSWDSPFLLPPGEEPALKRLEEFCHRSLEEYDQQRNFPAIEGTSQLSAALKFGVIGLREIWQATQAVYEHSRSDEVRENITAWQQELAWREFYQHCLYFFPTLALGPYRKEFKEFPWEDNSAHFEAWCAGKTGYPIVDAAMRQLNEIGWMHNRCRMIVASFLTKDLIINWQWGEKYFMQRLVDGDLSANNGGWQWSASSGMDPKPLRIFNPYTQAQKFDPEGDYIRQWVPELSSLDTSQLLSGKISSLERAYCNYPEPIVDHNQQQKEFKARYQKQKLT